MKRINKKIKIFWGISEVGFSIMSVMETSFLLYFLTDVAKYPLGLAAMISSFSAVADAVCAVLSGVVIDKAHFKTGKYRPWLLYCPPLVTLSFVFCFTKIGNDLVSGSIVVAAYVLSHFIWTIAWTANRNLISELTDDPGEKSFLSARIAIGASLGKIAASFLVPYLDAAIGAVTSGVISYTIITAIACCIFMACYFIHFFITKGYDAACAGEKKPVTFREMLRGIAGNSNLVAIVLHDAVRLISYYGIAASAAYYAKIVVGDPSVVTAVLLMFYAGTALGSCFSRGLSERYGVRGATAISCVGCAVFHGVSYLSPNMVLTTVLLFLAQASFGVAYGLTSKLYSMCGVYSEWKTGENTQGVIMSFCSLAVKLAIAVRGALIAAILGWIRYDPALTVVTPSAQTGVKVLFFLVFSVIMLLSLIPLAFFRLDDAKVQAMSAEIAARKGAGAKGAAQ